MKIWTDIGTKSELRRTFIVGEIALIFRRLHPGKTPFWAKTFECSRNVEDCKIGISGYYSSWIKIYSIAEFARVLSTLSNSDGSEPSKRWKSGQLFGDTKCMGCCKIKTPSLLTETWKSGWRRTSDFDERVNSLLSYSLCDFSNNSFHFLRISDKNDSDYVNVFCELP